MDEKMPDDLERMLLAAFLPADDRPAGVEVARRLADLLDAARRPPADPDEALAFLAATRAGAGPRMQEEIDREVDRLLARPGADPAVRERWDALRERMDRLDAASPAVDHFERLTGHGLRPPDRAREPLRLAFRYAAAAAIVLGMAGVLGRVVEGPSARMAYRSLSAPDQAPVRGAAEPVADRRQRALRARRTVMGFWPVYDRASLAALDAEIVASGDSSGWALLLLGEIRLMTRDETGAVQALEAAAARGSGRAAELVKRLR